MVEPSRPATASASGRSPIHPSLDLLTSSLRFYGSTAQGSCGKDGTHAQRWWHHRGAEEVIDGSAELTVAGVQSAYRAGELTSAALVESFLQRIAQIDCAGTVRSMIELNPDAVTIAEALDAERSKAGCVVRCTVFPSSSRTASTPLMRMSTRGGSLCSGRQSPPRRPSGQPPVEAGAVIIGKTNMSEWGYMPFHGRAVVGAVAVVGA